MIVILCPLLCPRPSLLLLISHLPFVIHHVPDDLEVPQVIIAQQLVLLGGVEQREVLHDDGCSNSKTRQYSQIKNTHFKTHQSALNIYLFYEAMS